MNPKRIQRIIRLLGLLQGGRSHNARSLAEACGVSRRTIFRDLDSLREAEVPLVYDEQRQLYQIPAQYFLAPTQFTSEEATAIVVLCHELGDDARLPFLADARSAAVKIENTLPQAMREKLRRYANSVRIRLGTVTPLDEQQSMFRDLMEGIAERKSFRIRYRSYSDDAEIGTKLSPYCLVFHLHSWYVVGRSSLHAEVRTFHIGRLAKLEPMRESFVVPRGFNLDQYFGNAWRMIPESGADQKVRLRFSKLVARNVAEVMWHKTQSVAFDADGTLLFEVTVSGLQEISWWLLGYGDQVEVLHPPKLRREIARRVRNMAAIYKHDVDASD